MAHFLYILRSLNHDKYYTGISGNPHRRLEFHNSKEKGFTSRYRPWEIVFLKECEDKNQAIQFERKIKSWKSRTMIAKLISGEIKL